MGYQTDLLTGFAVLLEGAGVGDWNKTGAYPTNGTTAAIFLRALPQTIDRAISLATYGVADDATLGDDVTGLQVTTRWGGGDPRPNDDLTDAIFDALQNLPRTTLSTGVVVTECFRRSWTSLGQDGNQRWRTIQNFYVTSHRPSTHRS